MHTAVVPPLTELVLFKLHLVMFFEGIRSERLHTSLEYVPPDERELQYAMCCGMGTHNHCCSNVIDLADSHRASSKRACRAVWIVELGVGSLWQKSSGRFVPPHTV